MSIPLLFIFSTVLPAQALVGAYATETTKFGHAINQFRIFSSSEKNGSQYKLRQSFTDGPIFGDRRGAILQNTGFSPLPSPASSISPSYYTANFGWACLQELKLEKATRLPLRFRLGSKDHVDYLEGKTLHRR